MKLLIALLFVPVLAAGIPSLTETQRTMLDTANDGSFATDEAALYPLLDNAMQWDAGTEAGAAIPDYTAISDDPASHRGELFLIEGQFNGMPSDRGSLAVNFARPGPWDSTAQEWYVVTDATTQQAVVVYLVKPGTPADKPPARGTKLRIPARFYKVYKAQTLEADLKGKLEPESFLVFVGHSPSMVEAGVSDGASGYLVPVLLLVMLALAGYYTIKRKKVSVAAQPLATRVRREQRNEHDDEDDATLDEGPPLPKDPIAALDELSRRRAEQEPTGDT